MFAYGIVELFLSVDFNPVNPLITAGLLMLFLIGQYEETFICWANYNQALKNVVSETFTNTTDNFLQPL